MRMPRPPPPATALMMTGIADVLGDLERLVFALDRAVAAGQHRHAGLLHRAARLGLVAEQPDHVRVGADEADVARLAHFGEVGALGQEAVARDGCASAPVISAALMIAGTFR